jgi:Mg2+/Co2+ transporter CorB
MKADMSKNQTITGQIYEEIFNLLEQNPKGIRWTDLNKEIKNRHPDFHPKTINGCVWKLLEKYPDKVHKPIKGLFQLIKYI